MIGARLFFFFLACFCTSLLAQTNCIQINELLVNGPGACDGGCNPNTEEWVELYNNCSSPVDIGCWTLGDGDFTISFPPGTIIPPGGFFLIGSNNSPVAPDLNIATCNCTTGTPSVIGTLTNANEQIILLDPSGNIADALQWGAGQFPVTVSSPSSPSCNAQSITFSNSSSVFEILSQSGANGCTMARVCDGAPAWEERCSANITGGASNGQNPAPVFTVSSQIICAGQCVNFNDQSAATGINAWQWFFPGAVTGGSTLQNPAGLCYNQPGAYDVTLSISSICGNFALTIDSFIIVNPRDSAFIVADTSSFICIGDSLLIVAGGAGPFQWCMNGVAIPGAVLDTLYVSSPGLYTIISGTAACADTSEAFQAIATPNPVLTLSGSSVLCQGDSTLLQINSGFSSYSFIYNNTLLSNQTDTSLYIYQPGSYFVVASSAQCSDSSNSISINSGGGFASAASVSGSNPFCEGDTLSLFCNQVPGTVQWLLNGTQIPGATDSILSIYQPGIYAYILNPQSFCADTSTGIQLMMLPAPLPQLTSSAGVSICSGQSTLLTMADTGVVADWYHNGNLLAQAQTNFNTALPGSYFVVVQYPNGCSRTSPEYLLSLTDSPAPVINPSSNTACIGDTVMLSILSGTFSSYSWSTGETTSAIFITTSGIYSVNTLSQEGCFSTGSLNFSFFQKPAVDAGIDQINDCGAGVQLAAFTNAAEFTWSPSDGLSSVSVLNPLANPVQSGYYRITAKSGSCENTDSIYVLNQECDLFLPTAFSPNGDNYNDVFRAHGPPLEDLHIGIYDRWGQLIAELHSYQEVWSGDIAGKPAASGVYQWVIFQARDLRGRSIQANGKTKGNFTLFR